MKLQIPEIPEEDLQNPTVNKLIELLWQCLRRIQTLEEEVVLLKDEIAKLKGQKPRPKLPPSKMADDAKNGSGSNTPIQKRRIPYEKRETIERIIQPDNIPVGSIFKGYQRLYAITEEALNYAFEQGLGWKILNVLEKNENRQFKDKNSWQVFLNRKKITGVKEIKIATEASLLGGAFEMGLDPNLAILSDGAGQFDLFMHALCWVHEERHYRKLIPVSENERLEIETVRSGIWNFYEELKRYKKNPEVLQKNCLSKLFDELFGKTYKSSILNDLLSRTRSRKEGLLLVLKYPFIPLHNNDCERDIREYVKRRKISGSTRSEAGRKARDTFTSLKKTCMKLGINFYDYLKDRLIDKSTIPKLKTLIKQKSENLYSSQLT